MTENREQKDTNFSPTPKMWDLVKAATNPEVKSTITAWCEEAGVTRIQWYRWSEVDGFSDWFNGECRDALSKHAGVLFHSGMRRAAAGDFNFWKVLMEKLGEYSPGLKLDHTGKVDHQHYLEREEVKKLSDEELDKLLAEQERGVG